MKFETPIAEVKKFELEDVLTASSAVTDPSECERDFCDGDCPFEGTLD